MRHIDDFSGRIRSSARTDLCAGRETALPTETDQWLELQFLFAESVGDLRFFGGEALLIFSREAPRAYMESNLSRGVFEYDNPPTKRRY